MKQAQKLPVYSIKKSDIPALLANLSLVCNEGSELYRLRSLPMSKTDIRSAYSDLLTNPDFVLALRIVANPDLYVRSRCSGIHGISETRLHFKKSGKGVPVLTEETQTGEILLTTFKNQRDYLKLFTTSYTSAAQDPAANFAPPPLDLDEFLFILHTIDSYRRISYQNMLSHVFSDNPHILARDFAATMAESLKSSDLRWLLPAFLELTPGVGNYETSLDAQRLEKLISLRFLRPGKLASGEDALIFEEAGQLMGLEFMQSWLLACGFEINISSPGGFINLERIFLAPTVLTNHFVQLKDEAGRPVINHQAYSSEQVLYKLDELLTAALEKEISASSSEPARAKTSSKSPETKGQVQPPLPKSPESSGLRQKFCTNCGSKLAPDSIFCTNCGMKI